MTERPLRGFMGGGKARSWREKKNVVGCRTSLNESAGRKKSDAGHGEELRLQVEG